VTWRTIGLAIEILLLTGALSGCARTGASDATTAAAANFMSQLDSGWNDVEPGGDTMCSDGSRYKFFVRRGNSDNLLVYLQGGGGCWMRENCDASLAPSYKIRIGDFRPDQYSGIFEFDNPANPFGDYSVVFAPYCTGDLHLGASDTLYAPGISTGGAELTIHHRGVANVQAVLEFAYDHIPAPEAIFITGSSAGSIPSPYYAVRLAEHYRTARVTQLGDAGGGYRQTDEFTLPHKTWNTLAVLNGHPAWAAETAETFNYERIYIDAAKYLPRIQFAEYDAAEDAVQLSFLKMMGSNATSLEGYLKANYSDIREKADKYASYMAGGEVHMILMRPEFYRYTVGEESMRDWVADLAAGNPVADVACTECALPDYIDDPIAGPLE
jgi:hypothetical protein